MSQETSNGWPRHERYYYLYLSMDDCGRALMGRSWNCVPFRLRTGMSLDKYLDLVVYDFYTAFMIFKCVREDVKIEYS